jgi:hypothetical protein
LLFVIACGSATQPPPPQPAQPAPSNAAEEKFTGTITEAKFGCAVDASCDLTVDNTKRVHFGHDTRLEEGQTEWGNTEEVFTLIERPDQGVGKRIEVFAAKTGKHTYTLQGKAAYYIKVLP